MILVDNVKKTYKMHSGDVDALDKVSIKFEEKGLTFILGKSGSGKTTLLNMLSGLDKPTEGRIVFKNDNINDYSDNQMDIYRNIEVGIIFQDYNLIESLNVYDNIALGLEIQQQDTSVDIAQKVQKVLEYVDLSGLGKRKTNELSGGQLQRVAIARALIKNPKIILADEPTGNLDNQTGIQIMELFKRISNDCQVIIISHDEAMAEEYADTIVRISDGKITSRKELGNDILKVSESNQTEDEEINDKEVSERNKKTKPLGLGRLLGFAWSSLFGKPLRAFFVTLLFGLSLFLLMITMHVARFNYNEVIIKYLEKYNVKELYLQKEEEHKNSMYETKSISLTTGKYFVNLIEENLHDIGIFGITNKLNIVIFDENGNEIKTYAYGDVNFVFDKEHIYDERDLKSGRLVQNKDEVLITDYIESELFENNSALGEEIVISGVKVKVVGIIDTDYEKYRYEYKKRYNVDYDYTLYHQARDYEVVVLHEDYVELYKKEKRVMVLDYGNFTMSNNDSKFHYYSDVYYYGLSEFETSGESLLAGRMPSEKNEVIVSKLFYKRFIDKTDSGDELITGEEELSQYDDFKEETYNVIDLYSDIYNHYYDGSVNLYDYLSTVKVVGIYNENVDGIICESDVLISQEIYDKMMNDYCKGLFYTDHGIVLKGISYKETVYTLDELGIQINEPSIMQIYRYRDALVSIKSILQILLFIVMSITVLVLFSFVSFSINSNTKNIGILRAIGVRKRDTIKIFILETGIITIVALIASYIFDLWIMSYINNMFANGLPENPYNIIVPNMPLCLWLPIITILIATISSILPINLLAGKKPIEIIKSSR